MKIKTTPSINRFLTSLSSDQHVSQDIRVKARDAFNQESIEWDLLKDLYLAYDHHSNDTNTSPCPSIIQLCHGSALDLNSISIPKSKTSSKSPELQAHLDKLKRKLEQDRYDAMVKDVTINERKAAEASQGGFVTYKQQISFGMHVLVMMGSFYLFGYIAGTALTNNKAYHYALGLALMICAMLLETVLFVIRTTVPPKLKYEIQLQREKRKKQRAATTISQNDASDATTRTILKKNN